MNYAADRFDTRRIDFVAVRVLVVEGTYVLGLDSLDVRIFMEATYTDSHSRRRARGRDVDSPFIERVLAIEHLAIAEQSTLADFLVDAHFSVRAAS